MSSDGNPRRPRKIEPQALPRGPLRDLKDALYELYEAAFPITLAGIHDRIQAMADASDGAGALAADPTAVPKKDKIRDVIFGPELPSNPNHVIAVAAGLIFHDTRQDLSSVVVVGNP